MDKSIANINMANDQDYFTNLPTELILHIFNFLRFNPFEQLKALYKTCQRFRDIIDALENNKLTFNNHYIYIGITSDLNTSESYYHKYNTFYGQTYIYKKVLYGSVINRAEYYWKFVSPSFTCPYNCNNKINCFYTINRFGVNIPFVNRKLYKYDKTIERKYNYKFDLVVLKNEKAIINKKQLQFNKQKQLQFNKQKQLQFNKQKQLQFNKQKQLQFNKQKREKIPYLLKSKNNQNRKKWNRYR